MKQITSSRDNLHVYCVPQGRIAACQVFAGKQREGTWHHSYFYFHFLVLNEVLSGEAPPRGPTPYSSIHDFS